MKIAFYISLGVAALAVASFFYFTSREYSMQHPQITAGLGPMLWSIAVMIVLLIWWIAYFAITGNVGQIWMPALFAIPFVVQYANGQIDKREESKHHAEWLQHAEDKVYRSKNFGVTFSYVSEDEFLGAVTIEEDENGLLISTSEKKDFLKVSDKGRDVELRRHVMELYSSEFPECRFYQVEPRTAETLGFPDNAKVVAFSESINEGCPRLGPNSDNAGRDYFFELNGHPEKVFFISLSSTSFEATKPSARVPYPPKWFGTLKLN